MRALPSSALTFTLAVLLGAVALPALAVPDIDVIYGDDIAHRGELAAELAARWSQTSRASDFGGRTLWQAVGELAYGVNDSFNLGIKVPVTRTDGSWRGHGAYLELKYLAPHGADGFYWGGEIEAGSIKPIGEEQAFVLEAFPIIGYRVGRFHFIANPGFEYSSEGEDKGWGFSPKAKLSWRLNDQHAVGLEYHVDAGKLGDLAPRSKRSEMAYLTWDGRVHGQQISVALGHGATHASDRWAVRIGIELDD
jgi:hypothetical protein